MNLHQESSLAKILIIKHPRKSVEALMKQIAAVSKEADETLDGWLKTEPALEAKDAGLPVVELKGREEMQSDQSKSLLLSGGRNLEIRMLVAQVQAIDYLRHMSGALEDGEVNADRAAKLKKWRESFEKLNSEKLNSDAFQLLGAKR